MCTKLKNSEKITLQYDFTVANTIFTPDFFDLVRDNRYDLTDKLSRSFAKTTQGGNFTIPQGNRQFMFTEYRDNRLRFLVTMLPMATKSILEQNVSDNQIKALLEKTVLNVATAILKSNTPPANSDTILCCFTPASTNSTYRASLQKKSATPATQKPLSQATWFSQFGL